MSRSPGLKGANANGNANGGERELTPDLVIDAARKGFVYLPLGGVGEIGMNFYLYGCDGKWIAVEMGVTFADATLPGIDLIVPDPDFAESLGDDLIAIVITHGHEDHLGAVPYLGMRFPRAPVYATPFAAGLIAAKLEEAELEDAVDLHTVPLGAKLKLGPFDVEYVAVTHSIPEPNALLIRTRYGTVLHTGDFKIDPTPLLGQPTDQAKIRAAGDHGILALVCDSTNATLEGKTGSEAEVRESLREIIATCRQRVAVACFASNVARLTSLVHAAHANGRRVALVGRSLWRYTEIARRCGYLDGMAPFLTDHDVERLPSENVLMICTGSQGEPNSALARIASRDHAVRLDPGDTVIFSSKEIPGNEKPIATVQNLLIAQGIHILTDRTHFVHVSGHPARDDLRIMYDLARPRLAIPMHGEIRHLSAHMELALTKGAAPHLVTDGTAFRLAPEPARVIGHVNYGRFVVDGLRLLPIDSPVLSQRRRLTYNGLAVVTVVLDRKGRVAAPPQVSIEGVLDKEHDRSTQDTLADDVAMALRAMPRRASEDDAQVHDAVRRAIRQRTTAESGKKPMVQVHLVRLD
ncbi:MAG TPA: ribonuclease J [Alphaproteobacteria bacterium]|nr:ribonuclease J [Alphaproteobacteria bacterium]